jgi:hypothetical protein
MSNDSEVQVKFTAEIRGLLEGLKQAQEHTETATAGMKGDLGSLIESIEHFGAGALLIGGVGLAMEGLKEGFEWVNEAIEKTNGLARAFEGLEFQTGESFENLNILKTGMALTGGTVQELEGWMKGATRAMKGHADMLVENGIAADKAALMGMPFLEYIKAVMEKADSIEQPFRRSIFLTEALGRAGMEAAPQIRRLLENMDQAKEVFDKYGNAIDEGSIRQMQAMEQEAGKLATISDTILKDIADHASGMAWGFKEAKVSFLQLIDAMAGGKSGIGDVFAGHEGPAATAGTWTSRGMRKVGKEGVATPDPAQGDTDDNLFQQTKEGWKKVADLKAEVMAKAEEKIKEGGKVVTAGELKERQEAAKEAAQAEEEFARAEAAVQKSILADKERYRIQQEGRETAEVLRGLDERAKGNAEFEKLQAQADRESAALGKLGIADQVNASKFALDAQKQNLETRVSLGQITIRQEAAQRRALVQQEMAIDVQAMQAELATANLSMVQRTEIENKIVAAKRKSALEMMKIDDQVALNYKMHLDGMTNGWDAGIQKMLHGELKLRDGVKAGLKGIQSYTEQTIARMGLDWMKGEIIKTAATSEGVAIRMSAEEGAALKSVALWMWAGLKNIAIAAYQAAANTYNAIASLVPYGPILAPIAAAVALGAVMSFGSHLASAEGGWDQVPSDQLAMIHKNEMILPAPLAERVRTMTGDGGGGSGSGGLAVHFHGPVFDKKGIEQFFRQNQTGLFKVIGDAARNRRMS